MKKIYFLTVVLLCATLTLKAQVPTITSFTPQKGNPGKQITITGTNFNTTASNNIVFFGAVRGIIVSATATSINVLAPVGATYGQIAVLNTGTHLYGFSKKCFTPTFSPKKTNITASDFLAKVDYPAGTKPTAIGIGDFFSGSDGRIDLIVADDVPVTLSRTDYYGSILANNSITGTIDSSSVVLYPNLLAGNRPQAVAIGDVYLNGYLDYAFASYGNSAFVINGSSSLSGATGLGPIDIAICDLDLDGKPDIVTANSLSFGVSVLLNTTLFPNSPTFAGKVDFTTGFQPQGMATGDIDGDGKPDIVIANSNNDTTLGLAVLRNTSTPGNISFAPVVNFTTGSNAHDVALADIDGDGKLDIIVTNQKSNTISVFRNTATAGSITTASLAAKIDFATGNKPKAVTVGDLNGDGKVDIVVTNLKNNSISIYQNNAVSGTINSTSLGAQITITTGSGSQPYDVAVADIDGDGRPDIEVANYNRNSISILKNEPSDNQFNIVGRSLEERAFQSAKPVSKTDNVATLYPNPAKDFAILSLNDIKGKASITLSDAFGNKIWQKQNTQDQNIMIPVTGLSSGLYFVTINNYLNTITLKLLKQ